MEKQIEEAVNDTDHLRHLIAICEGKEAPIYFLEPIILSVLYAWKYSCFFLLTILMSFLLDYPPIIARPQS